MQLHQKSLDLLAGSVCSSSPYSIPNTTKSSPNLVTSPELHSVFLDPEFTSKLTVLKNKLNTEPVSDCANEFTNLLKETIDKFPSKQHNGTKKRFPCNTWFDDECKSYKREVNNIARK